MMHNGNHEDFGLAGTVYDAERETLYEPAARTSERGSTSLWIGDGPLHRAFDRLFKFDAQAISGFRVKDDFLQ